MAIYSEVTDGLGLSLLLRFNGSNLNSGGAKVAKYTLIPVSEIPKRRVKGAWAKRLGIEDWAKFFADLPEGMAAMFPVESKTQAVTLEGSVRGFFKNHPADDFTPVCFYRKVGDEFQVFMTREAAGGEKG